MSRPEPPPPKSAPLLIGTLLLALLPWASQLIGGADVAHSARETWSSIGASAVAIAFGVWILVLLRRERAINERHLADLEVLTLSDPLTGLGNRRALERELARTMLRSRRLDHPLSLLFLDVDDLKTVNDRFGHAAGDQTLRAVGHAVRQCSRDGADSGYRVGGDEFVLIVLAGRDGAERLARRIHDGFQAHAPHQNRLSSGIVEWDGSLSASELLNEADRRMYRNKHMSRASTPVSDGEKD
jgi:diguanylate cyclase (GGDEF)-like protein